MNRLFVYGSLLNEEVRFSLIKEKFKTLEARLPGYRRETVRGQTYPAIVADRDSFVDGLIVMGLTNHHLRVLDRFEGRYYRRASIKALTADGEISCDTYVLQSRYRYLMSGENWSNSEFRNNHLSRFIVGYHP
jgi:gamma-glutamylcyclotransferase (GGCT)/AIG2-like uncharacterized protein YtfP